MVEKSCPSCNEAIRSDANVREFCTLCAMGIPNVKDAPKYKHKNGHVAYFCCNICLAIYKSSIVELSNRDKNV